MQSTFDISQLPDINNLRKLTQALAMLDAILAPEWEFRYYSFNSAWNEGEQMASMHNGQGDHWFLLFSSAGAALLAHEQDTDVATDDAHHLGIFHALPTDFHANFLNEPAFVARNSTFACWRRASDTEWHRGNAKLPDIYNADGSVERLSILLGRPEQYVQFASDYHEQTLAPDAVSAVYGHSPLTTELIAKLNPSATLESLQGDLQEIGYPTL